MKFDICIMNPPYKCGLHLKIMKLALFCAKDIINISPCTMFESLNERSKISEYIRPHIKKIEKIVIKKSNDIFDIILTSNLGIFHLSDEPVFEYEYPFCELTRVIERLRKQKSWRSSFTYEEQKFQYHCQGDNGFYKGIGLTAKELLRGKCKARLVFGTQQEKDNFYNSLDGWPYKLMRIIDDGSAIPSHLPFMIDYTKPWDDARFREYFNITDEEWAEIEKTMEKYK